MRLKEFAHGFDLSGMRKIATFFECLTGGSAVTSCADCKMLAEREVVATADEQALARIRDASANSARPRRENRDCTSTYRINFRPKPRRRNPDTDVRISSAKTIRTHNALRNNNAIMTASNIGSSRLWLLFFERIELLPGS
jgi:hypothetical protein